MDSCDAGTYYCALAACGEMYYLEDGIRENNEQQTKGINKTTYTVYKLYFIDCMDIVRDTYRSLVQLLAAFRPQCWHSLHRMRPQMLCQ
jgi:hypothetical protein